MEPLKWFLTLVAFIAFLEFCHNAVEVVVNHDCPVEEEEE